ncbi:platelet-derived growth factor receptor alpha-like [Copidosoma floridanum]|uniref:platelet-derived growth factor receptor alpha-like n=1 Tax=Copidosoma floridanum TaxID=29053 RepID=UPI0006C93E58|nr:platelet-derived growth factor receptor alpha-like [Copidosoma floridanum]
MVSASGKQVYDRTDIATVPANDSHHYVWTGKSYEKGTKVSVTAQDEFGCSGREGVHFMETIKANSTYRKSLFILVAIAVVGLCLLATGIHGFFAHLRRQRDRRFSSPSPSSRQLHSVFRNPKIEALLKHHNALYFDLHATEGAHHHKDPGDELEIPYSRLRVLRELGRGQFGKVYLADLLGGRPVAVKMSLGGSTAQEQSGARRELLKEIEIARSAGSHPNLVGMIGYCTAAASPVCLVLEYASRGDLLTYLHEARDKATHYTRRASGGASRVFHVGDHCESGPLSHAETTRFGLEIARGMEHLEARGIVHRDLAARNVLMDGNLVLKVSDFGLSRRGAYTLGLSPEVRRLPIRWMPPEAVGRGVFTSKSDVWSYGLVLWEIASLGDLPHPRIPDDQLLGFLVEREGRPEPLGCDPMRRIMDGCWSRKPEGRPHFWQIVGWLENEGHATSKNNPAYGELA